MSTPTDSEPESDPRDEIPAAYSDEIEKKVVRRIIEVFQQQSCTGPSDYQMGNAWEEFCLQLQYGRWPQWEYYELALGQFVYWEFNQLPKHEQQVLRLDCDEPLAYLFAEVITVGQEWKSSTIRAYLRREEEGW